MDDIMEEKKEGRSRGVYFEMLHAHANGDKKGAQGTDEFLGGSATSSGPAPDKGTVSPAQKRALVRNLSVGAATGSFKSTRRTEVHISMQLAAKEAKFLDFSAKCRSILTEIDGKMGEEEYNYSPAVDQELLLSLKACKNQRQ